MGKQVRDQYIQGLRDVADFLAAHPTLPTPTEHQLSVYNFGEDETLLLARRIAKQLGSFKKNESGGNLVLEKTFGPITLRFVLLRKYICQRTVVGTRNVERRVIPLNAKTEIVEEEIVEWKCPSLLSED